MTLAPCYRATCDAPGCVAAIMMPHNRTLACRRQLEAMGWLVVRHRVRSKSPGASRISYMCPEHRDVRPPGWREARASEIRRLAKPPRQPRPRDLSKVTPPIVHIEAAKRAAAVWMLVEAVGSNVKVARALGFSAQRVSVLVQDYESIIYRRQRSAVGWIEPWAKRLRAAGAIP